MIENQSLAGRTILDCSTLLPGPLIGKLLAQKGARVLKVESPNKPDAARMMAGGAFYRDLNEKKELVLLDYASASGRAKFEELVRQADGLIEGFRPSTKLKLGLDSETLHRINPKLCIVSLVGCPASSTKHDRPGHDLNFSALSGAASLFHEMPALPLADLFGAYEGAFAMSSALDHTARGGKGLSVTVSLFEALTNAQSGLIREFRESGAVPKPGETLFSGKFPCYRVYQAKEGKRIAMGAIEHKFWQRACAVLGVPELEREGYATGEWGQEVIAKVQQAFSSKTWKEWAPQFEAADCCVDAVLDYSEIYFEKTPKRSPS